MTPWHDQPIAIYIFLGAMIVLLLLAIIGLSVTNWDFENLPL